VIRCPTLHLSKVNVNEVARRLRLPVGAAQGNACFYDQFGLGAMIVQVPGYKLEPGRPFCLRVAWACVYMRCDVSIGRCYANQ